MRVIGDGCESASRAVCAFVGAASAAMPLPAASNLPV